MSQLNERTRSARDGFLSSSATSRSNRTLDSNQATGDHRGEKMSSTSSSSIQSYHTSMHEKPIKETDGYVGFANLPNQVYRKSVKKGFEFTLMVVGESGLGKSTLINSMFLTDIYSAQHPGPHHRMKKTVSVETNEVVLKEGGVELKLTVVDTPGFGDAVDNSNCWEPLINSIEQKYNEYLNAESRVNRVEIPDSRVHCCLYFIAPNGHGLKPLDIEFMKRLHDKVNIIPLIAKADTMTPDECRDFKRTILNEIAQHKIKIYEFPDPEDDEESKLQKKLKERVPFAVVGSNAVVDSNGRKVRGRVYPWGTVEVENLDHNDFIALRNMLIRTHMQDLKDVTNNVHYENFRYKKLAPVLANKQGKGGAATGNPPIPATRKKHVARTSSLKNPLGKNKALVRQTMSAGDTLPAASSLLSSPHRRSYSSSSASDDFMTDDALSINTLDSNDYVLELGGNRAGRGYDGNRGAGRGVESATVAVVHHSQSSTPPSSSSHSGGEGFLSESEMKERVALIYSITRKLNPLLQMQDEKAEHVFKMKKMEAEMEQVFEQKVKEKMQKLKDSEADLERRSEMMLKSLDQQRKELQEKSSSLERERALLEQQQDEERKRTLEATKKKKSIF